MKQLQYSCSGVERENQRRLRWIRETETEITSSIKIRTVLYTCFKWHKLHRKQEEVFPTFPSILDCGVDSIKNKVKCPNIYKQIIMLLLSFI